MADTLVLNLAWQPIDRISWQLAIQAVVSGRAEVIDHYEDWTVRSPSSSWKVPSIIRFLTRVFFYRRGVRFNRHNVWLRDKGACAYCQKSVSSREFTFDHVVSKKNGGKTTWDNIVVACFPCNQKKGDKTLAEARMKIHTKPHRPSMAPGAASPALGRWDESMPKSWQDFLVGVNYWHAEIDQD
jgi:5-methylcytosine-specific restriction endonuclease McrA